MSSEPIDERLKLAVDYAMAVFMDPLNGRIGQADVDANEGGLRLQLDPGQTMFVKTYRRPTDAPAWKYREPAGEPTPIEGMWGVEFIEGGPELPPPFNTHRLASWTELAGPEGERFAGTARYSIRFHARCGSQAVSP